MTHQHSEDDQEKTFSEEGTPFVANCDPSSNVSEEISSTLSNGEKLIEGDLGDGGNAVEEAGNRDGNDDVNENVPDGGFGWVIVFSSFMVHAFIGGLERSSGVLYLKFLEKFEESSAVTAWSTAVPAGIRLVFGPLASYLCTRFSCRAVVMLGGVMLAVSFVVSVPSTTVYHLFPGFGVFGGFGRCFAYAPAVMMVGLYFNKRRGLAVGVATSGVGVGSLTLPPLINFCFNTFGFWGSMLLLGGFIMNLSVCGALFRPLWLHWHLQGKTFTEEQEKEAKLKVAESMPMLLEEETTRTGTGSDSSTKFRKFKSFLKRNSLSALFDKRRKSTDRRVSTGTIYSAKSRIKEHFFCCFDASPNLTGKRKKTLFEISLLKNVRFFCFCMAILLFTLAFQSAYVFLPAYAEVQGISKDRATFLLSIAGAFDAVGRILTGTILDMDRFRPYRILAYNVIMFIVGAVSFIIPSLHSFLPLSFICALYGFLVGTYVSQKSVILVDILGAKKLVNSFGILIFFQGIGILLGPPLAGLLRDIYGTYDFAFYLGGTMMLLGAVILSISNVVHHFQMKHRNSQSD